MLSLLLVLQAAVVGEPFADIEFDLREAAASRVPDDAIVVTGRRRAERIPLDARASPQAEGLPRAETGLIGKSRIGAQVEQHSLAAGASSNRMMVKVKVPF